jgi:2-hydroxycyclohexanecarboxyl-CoA dehydrogenase
MDLGISGKVALVTGAGLGIGRRIALTLAEEGATVAVNDLYEERASSVAGEIAAAGGKALAVAADVCDYQAVTRMLAQMEEEVGPAGILVNNAGVPPPAPEEAMGATFVETGPEDWARRMDVIIHGVLNCTRQTLPAMMESGGGRIVSVVSDAGIVGEPGAAAYSLAKAGVIGFTKTIAKEVGRYRITANCVSPGATMVEPGQSDRRGRLIDQDRQSKFYERFLKAYPLGRGHDRAGLPSDVADPVVFLCSERAVWITGAVVRASGGFSIA